MFDALQQKFERTFKSLRGQGILNEQIVDETLREVRVALLEADVHLNVVKELLERVRVRALGEAVRMSLTPEQEVVRIVRDELVAMVGPVVYGKLAEYLDGRRPRAAPIPHPVGVRFVRKTGR